MFKTITYTALALAAAAAPFVLKATEAVMFASGGGISGV